jgi:hypothetical protein
MRDFLTLGKFQNTYASIIVDQSSINSELVVPRQGEATYIYVQFLSFSTRF